MIKQSVSFSPKIHNFSSVLAEWDIFSHDILSQNYPCNIKVKVGGACFAKVGGICNY